MTKSEKRKEITRLSNSISRVKNKLRIKLETHGMNEHGWTNECMERDLIDMQRRVNRLAGLTVFRYLGCWK